MSNLTVSPRGAPAAVWLVAGAMGCLLAADRPAQRHGGPGPESWPMFRNGSEQQGVARTRFVPGAAPRWQHEAGPKDGMIRSTAAIAGGYVYAASLNGEVFCLTLATGQRVWTYRSRETETPHEFIPGFKAAVAVDDELVYAGDEEGTFHAVERATGRKRWTFETAGEIAGGASFHGDHVLFGSHDNNLYCLRRSDGGLVWKFATEGMVNCAPAVSGNFTFVSGCDSHLRIIDAATGAQVTDIPLGIYMIASPAVLGDMLYVGTHGGEVLAIDWKKAQTIWTYRGVAKEASVQSSCAVNDDFVVVGAQDKRVHCINRHTGEKVWVFSAKRNVDSSPVIVGDRVYVGSQDGNLYGIELATGKEVFRFADGHPISASPAVGEGHLVIGSESATGTLTCFGGPK